MLGLDPGAWSRAPLGRVRRARLAALALVVIQVGIGIVMKASQTGKSYSFSPSGSIAISEFCKFLLSTIFFYSECRQRLRDGVWPSISGGESLYVAVPSADDGAVKSKREALDRFELDARTFWRYIRGEVPVHVRWGFCNLALFYVLINNTIFVSYKLADPGTIQLVKSGVTFITALVMMVVLNTAISKTQWVAIAVQICGLVVTQYVPGSGSAYPLGTYLILLFQVSLSALSAVYNQALLKSGGSSLHADNMILYSAGASFNMLIHLVLKVLKPDEPGFFTGYDTFSGKMVVVSNIFIGLAITAVYRYADAIIKCFATGVATGILLYLSPILFGTKLSFLAIPGTLLVFLASWLYLDHPPAKPAVADMQKQAAKRPTVFEKLSASTKRSPAVVLGASTLATVAIVACLTTFDGRLPGPGRAIESKPGSGLEYSPFNRTMAMVRWNTALPQRIPWIRKYEPFFHSVHISIPHNSEIKDEFTHTLSNDKAEFGAHIYVQLAMTMQKILDENPVIDGLLYFHFDAWIDPLQFGNMNFENIWLATSPDPEYQCTTKPEGIKWFWTAEQGQHNNALAALEFLQDLDLGYKIKDGEICLGWTDIYFIPRRFFRDYIFLGEVFRQFGTFHEIAIPTMLKIIDRTRRGNDGRPVMDLFSDCWGSCCRSNPTVQELTTARCGHRLDFTKEEERKPFYDKLDRQALSLTRTSKSPPLADLAPGYPRPLGNHKLRDEARISIGKNQRFNFSERFDHVNPKLDNFFDRTSRAKENEGKLEPKKD